MVLEEVTVRHQPLGDTPRSVQQLQLVPFEAVGEARHEPGDQHHASAAPGHGGPSCRGHALRLHGLLWHPGPVTRFHNYRSRLAPRAAALIAVGIAALALRLVHLHAVWSLM